MVLLGVETSCDETSAAIIRDNEVLSNIISSQMVHAQFGGVVPEIASREHLRSILPVVKQALKEAGTEIQELDGLAVTYGPGLVGALLVGLNFVKGLSRALNRPYVGVNHMEGHIYGNLLTNEQPSFPILFLIVSGGHTQLVLMKDHLEYEIIGSTRDDAVGEAFDKGAKMLGLGYPGGPVIDRLAQDGDPEFHTFPRAMLKDSPYDFSYSGLKTALLTYINQSGMDFINSHLADVCASYQAAAIDVLVLKAKNAAMQSGIRTVGIAGGVAANTLLRESLKNECAKHEMTLILPELTYCTDNAAMIARAGMQYLEQGFYSRQNLNAYPSLKLTQPKAVISNA